MSDRAIPSSPLSTSALNINVASSSSSPAKRVGVVLVVIAIIVFLISVLSPRVSSQSKTNNNILQPGDGQFVQNSNKNNNKNDEKTQTSNSQQQQQKQEETKDDVKTFWTRGTGGRVILKSLPSNCNIHPSVEIGAWSVYCDCPITTISSNENEDSSSSSSSSFNLDLEFAKPITKILETSCRQFIGGYPLGTTVSNKNIGSDAYFSCSKEISFSSSTSSTSTKKNVNVVSISNIISSNKKGMCNHPKVEEAITVVSSQEKVKKEKFVRIFTELDLKIQIPKSTTATTNSNEEEISKNNKWPMCFISIGDWGKYQTSAILVANVMEKVLKNRPEIRFIVSTGDNIYPVGAKRVDDPQFKNMYERMYSGLYTKRLMWLQSLGNHDHWNPKGELFYGILKSDRWFLPKLGYYSVNVPMPAFVSKSSSSSANVKENNATIFVLDTYGPGLVNQVNQMVSAAQKILQEQKSSEKKNKNGWRIAVGHQPIYGGAGHGQGPYCQKWLPKLSKTMEDSKIHMYLNGDDHLLEAHRVKGTDYFTSGGGGGSGPYDAKKLDSTLLTYNRALGFMIHCAYDDYENVVVGGEDKSNSNNNNKERFMTTEFIVAQKGLNDDIENGDYKKPISVIKTPFYYE